MKNRRFAIVSLILVMALVAGIGYAAISQTLTIDGTLGFVKGASESKFDTDVYFTRVVSQTVTRGGNVVSTMEKDESGQSLWSAAINASDNDNAIFSAKQFREQGEEYLLVLEVKHEGENIAEAALLTIAHGTGDGDDCFSAVYAFAKDETALANATYADDPVTYTLAPGETCVVGIKLTVKNFSANGDVFSATWNLTAAAGTTTVNE